jgi:hypothetical protein
MEKNQKTEHGGISALVGSKNRRITVLASLDKKCNPIFKIIRAKKKTTKLLGVAAHTCNPNTLEAERGGL